MGRKDSPWRRGLQNRRSPEEFKIAAPDPFSLWGKVATPSPPSATPWVSTRWSRPRTAGRPDHHFSPPPLNHRPGSVRSLVWGFWTAEPWDGDGIWAWKGSAGGNCLVRRSGSWPEAINKPSAAGHSRVRAFCAAPRAGRVGSGEASTDLLINQLWSRHRPAVKSAFEASSSFL